MPSALYTVAIVFAYIGLCTVVSFFSLLYLSKFRQDRLHELAKEFKGNFDMMKDPFLVTILYSIFMSPLVPVYFIIALWRRK